MFDFGKVQFGIEERDIGQVRVERTPGGGIPPER